MPGTAASPVVASLPAKGKLERLAKLFKGRKRGLVLTHDNPDPDSMASAWALAAVLTQKVGVPTEIAYGGIIGRAENAAFVKA
ncbi:MAG TPA: bifunctional oligoribonuclease/PAP phosphatase NrnA, partial [Archangium sp.]